MKTNRNNKNAYREQSIWIDFENAPHVWVMWPIIEYFKNKNTNVYLTARNFSFTTELCTHVGYAPSVVDAPSFGKSNLGKLFGIVIRAFMLALMIKRRRYSVVIALSHGSRSQIIAARCLNIPIVCLDDYEYSNQSLVRFVNYLLVPFPISKDIWGKYAGRIIHYPGLKEEIYLCKAKPNSNDVMELRGIEKTIILFRPESPFAHYRSPSSGRLQNAILEYIAKKREDIFLVVLPRDEKQKMEIANICKKLSISFWVPNYVMDGPSLISKVDLVLSGGGTMTREAAILGTASYSFFGGKWGAVDQYLKSRGKIVQILGLDDVDKIKIVKAKKEISMIPPDALNFVTDFIKKNSH